MALWFIGVCVIIAFQQAISSVGTATLSVALDSAFLRDESVARTNHTNTTSSMSGPLDLGAENPVPGPVAPPPSPPVMIVDGHQVVMDEEMMGMFRKKQAEEMRLAKEANRTWTSYFLDSFHRGWSCIKLGLIMETDSGIHTIPPCSLFFFATAVVVYLFRWVCILRESELGLLCRVIGLCRRLTNERQLSRCDRISIAVAHRAGGWLCNSLTLAFSVSGYLLCSYRDHPAKERVNAAWLAGLFAGGVDFGKSVMSYEWIRNALLGTFGAGVVAKVLTRISVEALLGLFGCDFTRCCRRLKEIRKTPVPKATPSPSTAVVSAAPHVEEYTPESDSDSEEEEKKQEFHEVSTMTLLRANTFEREHGQLFLEGARTRHLKRQQTMANIPPMPSLERSSSVQLPQLPPWVDPKTGLTAVQQSLKTLEGADRKAKLVRRLSGMDNYWASVRRRAALARPVGPTSIDQVD